MPRAIGLRAGLQQHRLFAGLLLSRLPKSYTGATAVLVDEFDAGGFQCLAQRGLVCERDRNLAVNDFHPTDRGDTNFRSFGKINEHSTGSRRGPHASERSKSFLTFTCLFIQY